MGAVCPGPSSNPPTYIVGKDIYGLPVSVFIMYPVSCIYDELVLLGQSYMAVYISAACQKT